MMDRKILQSEHVRFEYPCVVCVDKSIQGKQVDNGCALHRCEEIMEASSTSSALI